jgi:4-amino-4-deoxy-L-arabinose transferase-like glycosyltransferase
MTGVATAPRAAPPTRGDEPPANRRQRLWLLVLLAVALVVRLVWALYAAREPTGLHDPFTYLASAHTIADGGGYRFIFDGSPTAYFPIGYPGLLAGVVWAVDHTPLADVPKTMGVLQAFLGTASVWLVWRIASRLWDARTGLVAAGIMAVFPGLLLYTGALLSETVFVFLLLAAVAVLVDVPWSERALSTQRLVAFGVLVGLSALVRPQAVLLLPALALALLIARFGWRRALKAAAIALAAAVLTIAPWTVRNAITMDAFIPISSNTGDDLCIGHNPGANGAFGFYGDCLDVKGLKGGEREVERNRKNTRVALEYAWEHPRREAWLLTQRARYTYNGDYEAVDAVESFGRDRFLPGGLREGLKTIADGYFFVVLALALAGAALLWSRTDGRRTMLLLTMAAMALIPLAFFGDVRFHVPASPFFAIAAAVALTRLPALVRHRRAAG